MAGSLPRSHFSAAIYALALAFVVATSPALSEETALDRYVAKADPTYEWKVVREVKGNGFTQFIVDLKSQSWRTAQEVNQPVWQHWVNVVKPDKPTGKTALLFIVGGRNGGEAPQS